MIRHYAAHIHVDVCMNIYTLLPLISVFTCIVNSCHEKKVGICPDTEETWKMAEQVKNCSSNHCSSTNKYHCLYTEMGQLVEVCADPINLFDVCPYYDTVGKRIQRSTISCVKSGLTQNCTDVYRSTNVYNYQVCHKSRNHLPSQENDGLKIIGTKFWTLMISLMISVLWKSILSYFISKNNSCKKIMLYKLCLQKSA